MYKGQKDKEFFYILLYRGGFVRHFRKHQFNAVEYNKVFASGNSVKKVVANLKAPFDFSEPIDFIDEDIPGATRKRRLCLWSIDTIQKYLKQ
jgi:hypothetical protein